MKWTDRFFKFLDKHSFIPILLHILAYMLFIPPPFLLKQHSGVVEKVYDGYKYSRYSRGVGTYKECLYIKLENSDSSFNSVGKDKLLVKRSDLKGKNVVLKIRRHFYNDNLIIELSTIEGYI